MILIVQGQIGLINSIQSPRRKLLVGGRTKHLILFSRGVQGENIKDIVGDTPFAARHVETENRFADVAGCGFTYLFNVLDERPFQNKGEALPSALLLQKSHSRPTLSP